MEKFKLLICIDLQSDFIDGVLGTPEAQAIVPRIVEKINNYPDKSNTLLLYTKDTHFDNYMDTLEGKYLPVPHCIENTPGWSINKEIEAAVKANRFLSYSSDKIINSRVYKNTFGADDLEELLVKHKDEIKSVEFVGLCTSICVLSNVIMARQKLPNTEIIVDASCCACVTPESHKHALEAMKMCQINVINEE